MASTKKDARLESYNPATGDLIDSVATIEPKDVEGIAAEVAEVQPFWGELSHADRGRYMRKAAKVLLGDLDEVAALLTAEQGKPIAESYTMEVVPTVDVLHWCAENGPAILGEEAIPMRQPMFASKQAKFSYEPLGVIGVIAPWNYPWSIPFGEVAMALTAGNGVVLKPASLTPLLGEKIREIFEKAGLPEGLVRVVHGGGAVGAELCEAANVAKVLFTGSVEVGRRVGERCAANLKGSVLELGGKDAQIVCADADLDNASSGCVWGGFANAGQTCSGIERTYVVREVAEAFLQSVVEKTAALRVGDPADPETEIGPMVSTDQADLVEELVDDAIANGAERLLGGARSVDGLRGRFIAPTLLTGVSPEMRIMREEIFGPVVPITVVDSEEEALALANDSEFGLGASIWTRDRPKGERMARRVESGMVWINDHSYSHAAAQCAWGGVKHSGLGRSHSKFGFYECVNVKTVTWEPGLTRDFWWHPYDKTLVDAIRSSAQLLYGPGAKRLEALKNGAAPLLKVGVRTLRRK